MSSTRRHDLVDRADAVDEAATFKKPFQTLDRPPVTERDIHEQYLRDPPRNEPFEPNTDRKALGAKESASLERTGPQQEGVLGDPGMGKPLKQDVLEELTTESSVHPGNRSS